MKVWVSLFVKCVDCYWVFGLCDRGICELINDWMWVWGGGGLLCLEFIGIIL